MNDEDLIKRIKYQVSSIKEFVPDERDLLARIARARRPAPLWGIGAALTGASAALLMLLAFPGAGPRMEAPSLEDEVIESFGSALMGERALGWTDMTMIEGEEPSA